MAKRSTGGSSGGGCLGLFILLAIIGFVMQAWPYLLLIAACILGIWLLVKLFQHINAQGNGNTTRVNNNAANRANAIIDANYNANSEICYEVDRQIKEMLVRRRGLKKEIRKVKIKIAMHSFFWMKNSESHIQSRTELANELHLLEGRYNAAVYVFREPITQEFSRLKTSFKALCGSSTKTYDSTSASGEIMIPYSPKGDMRYINFSAEPICISIGDNIFCIAPYYIAHFKKSGAYISTYSCKALKGGVANGSYNERVKHVTWTYTRADGLPDRRYKNNPQRVYYTTRTHTVWNMLALGIVNYQLKYEVADSIKNDLIAAIRAYSALQPMKSYDPVHHLIRLLQTCEEGNHNINRLEAIVNGGTIFCDVQKEDSFSKLQLQKSNTLSNSSETALNNNTGWRAGDIIKIVFGMIFGVVSVLFAAFMLLGLLAFLISADISGFLICLSLGGYAGLIAYSLIRKVVRILDLHYKKTCRPDKSPTAKKITTAIVILLAISFVVGIAIGGAGNGTDSIDEQTIAQIRTKWESEGLVDYTDIAQFEKAVNDGENLIGKTVTFTVGEVHPKSALGHNLYGGNHLNFVSDADPGVKEGETISVIVTDVKRILTDSYKISYVLLNK